MDHQSDREKRRNKQKSKHEKFGQYSQKHVRQVEQNLLNVKSPEPLSKTSNKNKRK